MRPPLGDTRVAPAPGAATINKDRGRLVVDAVFLVLVLAALAAWAQGILHEHFDHDELEHTHVIWLIKQGHRPFYDFFECHPPFVWYLLGGVQRVAGDRYGVLFGFRFLTAVAHLLFFFVLARNVSVAPPTTGTQADSPWWWRPLALAFLMVAAQPAILAYLLEFRLDAAPNALLLFAILDYDHRRARVPVVQSAVRLGALSTVAILCSPKLVILLLSFVVFSLIRTEQRLRRVAAMAAGAGVAVGVAVAALLALHLNPVDVFRLSISYHSLLNRRAGFGYGMASAIWQQRAALIIVVVSAAAFFWRMRGRLLSAPFELAVASFLVFQLFFVSFPNKQYYGPWFVLGLALFPHLYQAVASARSRAIGAAALSAGLLYGGFNVLSDLRHYWGYNPARAEIAARRSLEALVPPDARVVVSMERRLLFRRDSLYHIASSAAPSGYNTARVMQALNVAGLGARFDTDYYRGEMERNPPALIVQRGWFTIEQQRAIDDYLQAHQQEFRPVPSSLGPTFLRRVPAPPAPGQPR